MCVCTSMEGQKVVVIQDASKQVSWGAIRSILHGFSLNPGDELIVLGVLHHPNYLSMLSFMGASNLVGFKSKADSGSIWGANQKFMEKEIARKEEEYHKSEERAQLSEKCKMGKIKFNVEVDAGHSRKEVGLRGAKAFGATWVILDRQMKKDKKYYLENLSCGISRMKRNDNIEMVRGPKGIHDNIAEAPTSRKSTQIHMTYDEMIPEVSLKKSPSSQRANLGKEQGGNGSGVTPRENHQKFPSSKPSSSSTQGNIGAPEVTTELTEKEIGEELQQQMIREEDYWIGGLKSNDVFGNSLCSVCENRRPKVGWKKEFTYAELYAATEGFSENNYLSEGGFGSVYRGVLKNGMRVAVKLHKDMSYQGEREFRSEVQVLSKARHKNLVMLLGFCSERDRRLLVYEYVCNGSLDQHLSRDTQRPLNWDNRIKIALGAANGLEYLHKENIIHRDVRPNNILITHDHESLLGDFGLARAHFEDSEGSKSNVVGTLGYLAPEYVESGKVSTKSDVYSFGVVLLELITGLRTTEEINRGKSLIGWARPLLKEKNYPDLIDQRIADSHDMHQLFWMVLLAEKCLCEDPSKRWTMESVVQALNYIIESNESCIQDFSPTTKSESVDSVLDSLESIGRGNSLDTNH